MRRNNRRDNLIKQNKQTATIRTERGFARHKLLFHSASIAVLLYLIWRVFFTLPMKYGTISIILGIILLVAEFMGFFETFLNHRHLSHYMEPELPVIPIEWYPDVDIFIATHNEPVDLLYKTLNACTFLEYPDPKKIHIHLCDDSNRPEMKALAEEIGVNYFGLTGNKEAKAGNLNNAMRQTHAPLVVTQDADMILHSDFLMKTVPYFFLPKMKKDENGIWVMRNEEDVDPDYKIGYIQSPQSFYNPDLFQFYLYSENSVPNEQDYFFQEVNVAHNYDNATIYAGSNTVISREALEEIGYIATGSITEDYLTGIRIQKKGYRNFGISEPLAHGLAPTSTKALLSQRERWARGTVQALRMEHALLTPRLSFWQKVSLLSGLFYWMNFPSRMVYLVAPMATVLFSMRFVDASTWQVLAIWLPAYLIYNRAVRVLSGNKRSYHWNNVIDTIQAPYLTWPILAEVLGIKKRKFVVTDKARVARKEKTPFNTFVFSLPYLFIVILDIIALVVTIVQSVNTRSLYSPIIMYWLVSGIKDLMFSLFFVYGRRNVRAADRFYVSIPVTLKYGKNSFAGTTSDISEGGFGAVLKKPAYFPSGVPINVTVRSGQYSAQIQCSVMSVTQAGGNWKYGLKIESMDEKNKRLYMQIVYDRTHTLPNSLSPTASVFGDLNRNLMLRTKRKQTNLRRLPRLELNLPFITEGGERGTFVDFNFEFAFIKLNTAVGENEVLRLEYGDKLILDFMPCADMKNKEGKLFRLEDRDALLASSEFDRFVDQMVALENTMSAEEKLVGRAMIRKRSVPEAEPADPDTTKER